MRTKRTAFPRPKRAAAVDARVSVAPPPPALLFLEEPALPACVLSFLRQAAVMKLATSLENMAKKWYSHLPPLLFALPLFLQELKATAERVGVSKEKALEVVAKELKVSLS